MLVDVIFTALIVGMLCGAVPMIFGAVKGELGLGLTGFVVCTVCGLILGMLLAIPAAGVFTFLIAKKDREKQKSEA